MEELKGRESGERSGPRRPPRDREKGSREEVGSADSDRRRAGGSGEGRPSPGADGKKKKKMKKKKRRGTRRGDAGAVAAEEGKAGDATDDAVEGSAGRARGGIDGSGARDAKKSTGGRRRKKERPRTRDDGGREVASTKLRASATEAEDEARPESEKEGIVDEGPPARMSSENTDRGTRNERKKKKRPTNEWRGDEGEGGGDLPPPSQIAAPDEEMGGCGGGDAKQRAAPTRTGKKDDPLPTPAAKAERGEGFDAMQGKATDSRHGEAFDAVCVAPADAAAEIPFWKRKKNIVYALILLVVGSSAIVAGVMLSPASCSNANSKGAACEGSTMSRESAPTLGPTSARMQEEEAILERLAGITPGGVESLLDADTVHHKAFMWLVYEDGMELGAAADNLHQRYVLMSIYFTSGPWTPVDGQREWGAPVHECEWEGIYCKDGGELEAELGGGAKELQPEAGEDGIKIDMPWRAVNRLHLRQRLVSGEVPAEFSLLYYLQHLDLESNIISGPLPTPLYKLSNLQTLFLEQNELTNVDTIGDYRHLEHLSLSKNLFQGPLPESFRNLKKLKTLYLHTNGFTGSVLDILKDFTSMEHLDLAFNEFEGTLPSELGSMKNLTSVFIGHNNFQGTVPNEIGGCENLKEFVIDGSYDIGGPIPSEFGQLPKLELLKLDTCAFSGALPASLGNLQRLRFLDVGSNDLKGRIPTQLGKATSLVTLALANNGFEGGVPREFGELKKLEALHLQNTDLSGEIPKEVCDLRTRGNQTVLEVLWVPCDVECEVGEEECCTNCS